MFRKPPIYGATISPACSYCSFGTQLEDGSILCIKKGLRTQEDSCRKFKYDPCKRIPKKMKALDFSKYDDMDFSL